MARESRIAWRGVDGEEAEEGGRRADEAGDGTAVARREEGRQPEEDDRSSAAAALVLTAGAGGAYFAFGRSDQDPAASAEMRKPVAFVDIREMTVNLAPEPNDDRPRFLKFRVALEVKDAEGHRPDIQPLLPRVEDSFQVFVRELRASDLEGSSGVYRLREELLRRVNIARLPGQGRRGALQGHRGSVGDASVATPDDQAIRGRLGRGARRAGRAGRRLGRQRARRRLGRGSCRAGRGVEIQHHGGRMGHHDRRRASTRIRRDLAGRRPHPEPGRDRPARRLLAARAVGLRRRRHSRHRRFGRRLV